MVRFILPLLGSLVLGVLAGQLFFGIFNKTVPPAVLTSFNKGTAHAYFIVGGIVLGLVMFVWSLLVAGMMAATRKREPKSELRKS
jgi:hypothetical protein